MEDSGQFLDATAHNKDERQLAFMENEFLEIRKECKGRGIWAGLLVVTQHIKLVEEQQQPAFAEMVCHCRQERLPEELRRAIGTLRECLGHADGTRHRTGQQTQHLDEREAFLPLDTE